jgi:Predicted ATPases of PP-loop superfamily
MIDSGLRAKLTCIDTTQLDATFAGQEFDREFVTQVPDSVDPCGERGEFHSFVYAGPMLNSVIPVSVGEIRVEERFVFADLYRSDSRAEPKQE